MREPEMERIVAWIDAAIEPRMPTTTISSPLPVSLGAGWTPPDGGESLGGCSVDCACAVPVRSATALADAITQCRMAISLSPLHPRRDLLVCVY
jgi:hypothetical protein